jgi:hypothetical protein
VNWGLRGNKVRDALCLSEALLVRKSDFFTVVTSTKLCLVQADWVKRSYHRRFSAWAYSDWLSATLKLCEPMFL